MTIPPMPRYDESCRDWIDCVRDLEAWGTQGWAEVQALRAELEEAEEEMDLYSSDIQKLIKERDAARADAERLAEALTKINGMTQSPIFHGICESALDAHREGR